MSEGLLDAMSLKILNPGLMTTVQDLGRFGYAHYGVTPAGAADALALRVANRLLGNAEQEAGLEMTLLGPTIEFERTAVVVLTGANIDCRLSHTAAPARSASAAAPVGARAPMWKPFPVLPGAVLKCGPITGGARAYLAVQGGFEITPVMNSAATLRSAHLGGFAGRELRAGDRLEVKHASSTPIRSLREEARPFLAPRRELRITTGPQSSWFGKEEFAKLQRCPYAVLGDSDRRGVRLRGEALTLPPKSQLVTEGISLGAMQVPPDGQPIILFVDQQTTGGYPKVANVIAADLRHLAQLRPRDEVRFRLVTVEEAVGFLRQQEQWLEEAFQVD
jgi:antagonist of KipI